MVARAPAPEVGGLPADLVDDVFQRSVSDPWALDDVLALVIEDFQPGVEYGEREVNAALYGWHGDWAALRRLLVDHGLLARRAGVYRRIVTDDTVTADDAAATVIDETR